MTEPCPRRDKWFRACKFEPRFDLSPVELPGDAERIKISVAGLEKFRAKTYCGDVCVTCGRVVHPMESQP